MGKGTKRKAKSADEAHGGGGEVAAAVDAQPGLTALELQRAAIIERNRQRLLALGIPSLVKELQQPVAGAAGGGGAKRAKKKAPRAKEGRTRVKKEGGAADEQPTRRSSRLREAAEHPKPKPETAQEQFERELGQFAVEGSCPRCGKELERGQRPHLEACRGARPVRQVRQQRPKYEPELEELDEEERADAHKRTLARMKALHLDGLMELTEQEAKFAVLGSTGNHYTVTLKDDKHTCQCMDYRFRRHNCKHICLCLDQLGILEQPQEAWKAAVEERLDELVQQQQEREALTQVAPRSKSEDVGLRLL